jgi:hypothetical protein
MPPQQCFRPPRCRSIRPDPSGIDFAPRSQQSFPSAVERPFRSAKIKVFLAFRRIAIHVPGDQISSAQLLFSGRIVRQTREFRASNSKGSRGFESPSVHRVPIFGDNPLGSPKSPPQRPHLQICGRGENHFSAVMGNSRRKSLLANSERPFGPEAE